VNLYIMRHGEAANLGAEFPSDGVRPLTFNGRKRVELSTKGLSASGVAVDKIISSPLVRARQTAEIVHEGLAVATNLEFSDALPIGDIDGIVKAVQAHTRHENVMLVGHEPTLTRLISVLVSGAAEAAIDMPPGGLCMLTLNTIVVGQCATLRWFPASNQLVALGK
jgi:phosphohistidine phosphatase